MLQSSLARYQALEMLKSLGLVDKLAVRHQYTNHFDFFHIFCSIQESLSQEVTAIMQDLWTENGDMISRQYAGTDAMKVNDRGVKLFD